jgi:cell division GTPase FtsZ
MLRKLGLALVQNSKGMYEYIDKTGKMVIDYQKYTRAFDFSNGIALVGIGTNSDPSSKFGYIDRQGKLLTKLEYRVESSSFQDGYAVAIKTEGKGIILSKDSLIH